MSTTSTVITIAICAVIAVALGLALVKGLWSAAKKITIPLQIALFVVMLVCVVRLFCTKENAQRLYRGIEQTGIGQNMENTMRAAFKGIPKESGGIGDAALPTSNGTSQTMPTSDASDLAVPAQNGRGASPMRPQGTGQSPTPRLEISFADNAYRVTVDCPGSLDAAEKKAVGRQILAALGRHVGKTIARVDKSKVSIESRYDETADITRVVAIIPPDAID